MADFGFEEMMAMQRALREKYKDKWTALSAEEGRHHLLWMIGEVGEVIDIVKKHGGAKAASDEALRAHLTEELADVMMYYTEVLMCYGITPEELRHAYIQKFEKNMTRW